MKKQWHAEDFDQCYREKLDGFEDGFAHAVKQGIPRFIEEYRISRVKDSIAPWIVGSRGQRSEIRDQKEEKSEDEKLNSRPPTTDHRPLILDLGCGNGWYPIRLIEKWGFKGEIVGIDVSSYNIEIFNQEVAKRGLKQIETMVGNIESLPFEKNCFDIVYATETLEHVKNPAKVFAEAYRVLKPGGEFVITTPSGPLHNFWNGIFFFPRLIKRLFMNKKVDHAQIYDCPMSYKRLRDEFTQADFELIHYHKAIFLPHESYIRFFPRPLQYIMLWKAKCLEFLGPLTMYWGLHHIIRLKK